MENLPHSGVETFSMLKDVQSKSNLHTFPLLLNSVQGSLQVQPERDFLKNKDDNIHK